MEQWWSSSCVQLMVMDWVMSVHFERRARVAMGGQAQSPVGQW